MKRFFLTILVSAYLTLPAQAQNTHIPQIENGLYNLLYIRQQMQAVDNDMILYFGWMPEEKQGMKPSVTAI